MRCRFRAEKMPMVIDHDKTKTVGALISLGIHQRLKYSTEAEAFSYLPFRFECQTLNGKPSAKCFSFFLSLNKLERSWIWGFFKYFFDETATVKLQALKPLRCIIYTPIQPFWTDFFCTGQQQLWSEFQRTRPLFIIKFNSKMLVSRFEILVDLFYEF